MYFGFWVLGAGFWIPAYAGMTVGDVVPYHLRRSHNG